MKKLILIFILLIIMQIFTACGTEIVDSENAHGVHIIYETYEPENIYEPPDVYYELYTGIGQTEERNGDTDYELYTGIGQTEEQNEDTDAELLPLAAEALYLVELIETVHPIFIIEGMLPDNYDAVRAEFLSYAAGPINRIDFAFAIQRYFTVLQDGHMARRIIMTGDFLDINFFSHSHRLFIHGGQYSRAEVLYIGGAPVYDILNQVDRHYFAENDIDRRWLHALHSRDSAILRMAGAEVGSQVEMTLLHNDEQITITAYFSHKSASEAGGYIWNPEYIIRYEIIGDVFYISLREFRFHHPYHRQTVEAIENAIASGIHSFIVDLRGNPGGNSIVGQELLEAMGITVPGYGQYIRISDLALAQRSDLRSFSDEDMIFQRPLPNTASNPNDVFVMALTDTLTYGSATMFAAWVQDGGFGSVMGLPSRNRPSMFGDMLNYRLPLSGLDISISHAKFLRPNAREDQYVLHPDFFFQPGSAVGDATLTMALMTIGGMRETGGIVISVPRGADPIIISGS